MSDVLIDKRADGIALITLNRPESLNAMGGELMPLLARYLAECATDPSVRCVVLTGAGRAFCAGGDVKVMASAGMPGGDGDRRSAAADFARGVEELRVTQLRTSYALHTMPKPTIAMVNGYAVGAGLSLCLAADLRVASEQARFGTAFRNVGLSGDFGGSYFLQRLVGFGKARELYFTAEIVDAETALKLGMVNRVVPHDRLEEETLALAAQLAGGPTLAYSRMKENLTLGEHSDLRALLDQEALNMRLSGTSSDFREATKAFVEKRTPAFKGE